MLAKKDRLGVIHLNRTISGSKPIIIPDTSKLWARILKIAIHLACLSNMDKFTLLTKRVIFQHI